jgi:PKD repeat protein
MNRTIYTLAILLGISATTTLASAQHAHKCGNETHMVEKEYPGTLVKMEAFQNEFEAWKQTVDLSQFELSESGERIIPVVVHVLHEGGSENITKAQIQSQITAINKDFVAANTSLNNLDPYPFFDTLVANCNIKFRLASKDPWGNCTDGIVRVYTQKTNEAKDFTRFKQQSYWDRDKYFNVWVVKTIFNDTEFGTILGYAQFPFAFGNQFPLTSTDGVAVIHNVFGTTGTAAGNTGATLSHEVGHWLGLRHIWGDEECGNDGVDDTPIHKEPNFSGPNCFPIPKTATCYDEDTIARDIIGEMWMNFMDYTSDPCLWMFSKGQKQVIDYVFNTIPFRGNLINNANNVLTGTDDASYASLCTPLPIADFWSRSGTNEIISHKLVCAGGTVGFTNGTYNATPSSLEWTFEGGSPATSTTTAPSVTYPTAGQFDVTLTANSAQSSSTKLRGDYVLVYNDVADESKYIYYEPFEYGSLYEQGKWLEVNEGNQSNKWEIFDGAGYYSNKSMRMNNSNNVRFETDALISPMYDLTTFTNDVLSFKYAYAVKTAAQFIEQPDELNVYISTNCGQNWNRRQITVDNASSQGLKGARLITAGLDPDGFIPNSPLQWKEAKVNITPYINEDNVRIMFMWTSGGPYGNDLFIDDVTIQNGQAIGIEEEMAGQTEFKVFPNPVSSVSQIYFNLLENASVQLDLIDLTGRTINHVFNGNLNTGEQTFEIDNSKFSTKGVYFVRLTVNGATSVQKILVD